MAHELGTTAQIDSALRRGFSEASVRVHPDTKMTDIVAALATMDIVTEIQDDTLVLRQDRTMMHTVLALRNFAKQPEHAAFFVQDGAHPSTWSTAKKIEYLSTHSDDEYRALIQSPVLEAGVRVLDPNMSKADYLNLTRLEKTRFISEYGPDAVSRVMGKKK
jgi:hypothetical protein